MVASVRNAYDYDLIYLFGASRKLLIRPPDESTNLIGTYRMRRVIIFDGTDPRTIIVLSLNRMTLLPSPRVVNTRGGSASNRTNFGAFTRHVVRARMHSYYSRADSRGNVLFQMFRCK